MTYGELKLNVADLGFDNVSELMSTVESGQSIAITAMNRAINIIQKTIVERYKKYFERKLSVGDKKISSSEKVIDLPMYRFNVPTIINVKADGKILQNADYMLSDNSLTIFYDADSYEVNLEYNYEIPTIKALTTDTDDDFEIQIPDKVIDLVPLLAAHYAWLDDDVQKATIYWNEYDDLKKQLMEDMDRLQDVAFYDFGYGW